MVSSVRARSASSSPSTEALIAHILRRTTFGPFPGQVEAYARRGVPAALDAVLRARPLAASPAPLLTDDTSDAPVTWWLDRMAQPKAGIHEKLTWFWHGHLTTSHDKVFNWRLEFPEHRLLRTHALGNFRALLQAITVDPAMLVYLDGDGSNAIDPNENYGRELMELFCLGRAQYTQADDRVLVATTSEFGRRVPDNASNGLDHGAGSFALVAGAPAAPGLYGSYPDLAALDADDNLIATVDLWDYYATLAEAWLGVPASSVLGPGATPIPGLIAA